MKKLFNLKEWLTISDTAKYLSLTLGEEVAEADVLRLALDGHLRLSVNFIHGAIARRGNVGNLVDEETKLTLKLHNEPDLYPFSALPESMETLKGVWDLPMLGDEVLEIENEYQRLTGGYSVFRRRVGIYVNRNDGEIFQLQDVIKFIDSQYSRDSVDKFLQDINENNIPKSKRESLWKRGKLLAQKMEKEQELMDTHMINISNYFPAPRLPDCAMLIIRTEVLREFEQSINDTQTVSIETSIPSNNRAHVSDKLAKVNQAAEKFWANTDRNERGTHPDNARVAAWLVEQGFSGSLAEKAATIIRPEWVPTGRKPEE